VAWCLPVARGTQAFRLHSTLPTEKQQQVFRTGDKNDVAMETRCQNWRNIWKKQPKCCFTKRKLSFFVCCLVYFPCNMIELLVILFDASTKSRTDFCDLFPVAFKDFRFLFRETCPANPRNFIFWMGTVPPRWVQSMVGRWRFLLGGLCSGDAHVNWSSKWFRHNLLDE